MNYIVKPEVVKPEEMGKFKGGQASVCYDHFCSVDAGCGQWNKCIQPQTYYGCTGGKLERP